MYVHISHILKLQNGISVLNVSAGFKITLCGPNLRYAKTKNYAIWQLELQNWAAKQNFVQSKRKRWKKNTKKNSNGVAEKALPCGNGSYNFEKDTKSIFDRKKMKKEASSGEKKSGSKPMSNSLASFRHQRGRNSTDPRRANACTNSCGWLNSAQLYKEKLSYCFAGWHCWNGVNKTKGIEQSTVQRHGKEVRLEGRVEGGELGGLWLEWKVTLSCPKFIFIGWMKRCGDPLS